MAKNLLLSVSFVLLGCYFASAQEYLKIPGEIFNKVKTWRDAIDSFFAKEDAGRLSRNLGYLYQDFGDYLDLRKSLTDGLERTDFKINNKDSLKKLVSAVSTALRALEKRTVDINQLIIAGTGIQIDSAETKAKRVQGTMQLQRQEVVTRLYDYIHYGKQVNIVELKRESKRIYEEMEKAREMVLAIQKKVKDKFMLTLKRAATNSSTTT